MRGEAATLVGDAQQQVFGPYVVVTQPQRFARRQPEGFLRAVGERNVARQRVLATAGRFLNLPPDAFVADPQGRQHHRADAVTLMGNAQQDVLWADVIVT
jgi:hypothetical protein